MGRAFANLAFTPLVKQQQQQHGSRELYERLSQSGKVDDRLGEAERDFISRRDGFYMASVTETGWPYIQFRGGAPGFLRILDDTTLGFADLRGNRQYISTGNFQHDARVALFLMDYAYQARLKILGRVSVLEGTPEAARTIADLRVPGERSPAERALLIHVEAFDWNCPQHITPRFTEAEIASALVPLHGAHCRARTGDRSAASPASPRRRTCFRLNRSVLN